MKHYYVIKRGTNYLKEEPTFHPTYTEKQSEAWIFRTKDMAEYTTLRVNACPRLHSEPTSRVVKVKR